jgi:hypothetical protein
MDEIKKLKDPVVRAVAAGEMVAYARGPGPAGQGHPGRGAAGRSGRWVDPAGDR